MVKLEKLFLKDVMVKEPFTIGIDEPFGLVWDIFRLHKIRHLPVLLNDRLLVGMITQRDLYSLISPQKTPGGQLLYNLNELNAFVLKDVMTREVLAFGPEDLLGVAVDAMVKKNIGCIPVVDNTNYLLGVITRSTVLKLVSQHVV